MAKCAGRLTEKIFLQDVKEGDLPIFFEQQLEPAANYVAAFTAQDPADRDAFTTHWAKILADDTITRSYAGAFVLFLAISWWMRSSSSLWSICT